MRKFIGFAESKKRTNEKSHALISFPDSFPLTRKPRRKNWRLLAKHPVIRFATATITTQNRPTNTNCSVWTSSSCCLRIVSLNSTSSLNFSQHQQVQWFHQLSTRTRTVRDVGTVQQTLRSSPADCYSSQWNRRKLTNESPPRKLSGKDDVQKFGLKRKKTLGSNGFYHFLSEVPNLSAKHTNSRWLSKFNQLFYYPSDL